MPHSGGLPAVYHSCMLYHGGTSSDSCAIVSNASMTSSIFSFVSAFCSAKLQHAAGDMLVVWQPRCAAEAAISPHRCVRVSVGL